MKPFPDEIDILPLSYYGNPILKKKSRDILAVTDEVKILSKRMIKTMYAHNGIGLAGAQIGLNINIVVLDISVDSKPREDALPTSPGEINLLSNMPLVLINPKISSFSEQETSYEEGCLSIPGITAEVVRPEFIQLNAELLNGKKISYRCGGLLSRCIQHEIDHLNGILFIELLAPEVLKKFKRNLRQLERATPPS